MSKPTFELYLQDCVAWLRGRPTGSIGLHIHDAAYECLEKHRATGTTTRLKQSKASSNAWFKIFPDERYDELYAELYRTLPKHGHCYSMCAADHDQQHVMITAARKAGFHFWKAIVWDKMRTGMGYHWRNSHEVILFFEKGKRRLRNLGWRDVVTGADVQKIPTARGLMEDVKIFCDAYAALAESLDHGYPSEACAAEGLDALAKAHATKIDEPSLRGDGLYPTEKPAPLWARVIENSSEPGELVADCFMGSGSSGEAALKLGRCYAGCDLSEDSVRVAYPRLLPHGDVLRGGGYEP